MPESFTAGTLECLLLVDGEGGLPADLLLATAPPDERAPALGDRLGADGRVPMPYQCLLVRGAGATALVDTGIGPYEHPLGGAGGRLEDELREAGVAPGQVDVVVVTHGHLDHIGGLCVDGRPRFRRARYVISRAEWERCSDERSLARMSPLSARIAREQLAPLAPAGVLELADGELDVAPEIRVVAAPGHTPGQLAVELGGRALALADAVADRVHVERPEWTMAFDDDPQVAVETRRRLLGRAADEELLVTAAHVAGVLRVERAGDGFVVVAPTAA